MSTVPPTPPKVLERSTAPSISASTTSMSEQRLGAVLEGRRHEAILATKCGRYGFAHFDFTAARLRASIDESLQRRRTDYADVFLAHDIEFAGERQIIEEAIPALREIQRSGKARAISEPRRDVRDRLTGDSREPWQLWYESSLHFAVFEDLSVSGDAHGAIATLKAEEVQRRRCFRGRVRSD